MKKVIGILATALILSGCGSSSDNHEIKKTSFMKEGKNSLYALYNTKGQRYTKDMYKTYTPFEGLMRVIRLVIFLIQVKQLLNQDVIQA